GGPAGLRPRGDAAKGTQGPPRVDCPVRRVVEWDWLGFRAMNRNLMLWALLVGSVIGLGEAIAETASPSWAESVGDHWTGLVAMSLVVFGLWVVSESFTKPTRGIRITL